MTGVLDFATSTATVIRDSADRKKKNLATRYPRLISDVNGGLPIYDEGMAKAQDFLLGIYPNLLEKLFFTWKIEAFNEWHILCVTESRVYLFGETSNDFLEIFKFTFDQLVDIISRENRVVFDLKNTR